MSANYTVQYEQRGAMMRWTVRKGGPAIESHSTLQSAVSSAKARAAEENGSVVWCDRNGNEQGHANYGLGA